MKDRQQKLKLLLLYFLHDQPIIGIFSALFDFIIENYIVARALYLLFLSVKSF
jgi:hypothetical protein